MKEKTIGVLGGMGPEATLAFFGQIIAATPAVRDQEHLRVVIDSNPKVPDRTAAEQLKGARVMVSRSSFATAGTDEYYWVDLLGLQVINREGVSLGEVKDLLSTGPQTVLVLEYPRTDTDKPGQVGERMIPFVSAYVDSVDLPQRRILVDWQPDY